MNHVFIKLFKLNDVCYYLIIVTQVDMPSDINIDSGKWLDILVCYSTLESSFIKIFISL